MPIVTFRASAIATAPAGWIDTTEDFTVIGTFYFQGVDVSLANATNATAAAITLTNAGAADLVRQLDSLARGANIVVNG